MDLFVGGHLDLPVALGIVGVVRGVVGTLDGNLGMKYENIGWISFVKNIH